LVWSDYGGSVRTSNLDGTNVQTIANNAFGGVAVDNATGSVYWAGNGGTVWSANFNGTNAHLLVSTGSQIVWNMAIDGGKLFFNSQGNSVRGVGRVNLDGSGLTRIGDNADGEGLTVDHASGKVIYQHFGFGSEPYGTIKTVAGNGSSSPSLLANQPNLGFVPGLFVDNFQNQLYFAVPNANAIYRSNLDGSSLQRIAQVSGVGFYSIYVDSPNNTIYWGSRGDGFIGRMDLDGSNRRVLTVTSSSFYALTVYSEPVIATPAPPSFVMCGLALGMFVALVGLRRLQKPSAISNVAA
jgi:hypothetical protein